MLPLHDFERYWHMKRSSLFAASAVAAVLGVVAAGWLAIELMRGGTQSAMFKVGGPFVLAAARGGSVDAWRAREIGLRKAAGGAPFLRTVKVSAAAATAAAQFEARSPSAARGVVATSDTVGTRSAAKLAPEKFGPTRTLLLKRSLNV